MIGTSPLLLEVKKRGCPTTEMDINLFLRITKGTVPKKSFFMTCWDSPFLTGMKFIVEIECGEDWQKYH